MLNQEICLLPNTTGQKMYKCGIQKLRMKYGKNCKRNVLFTKRNNVDVSLHYNKTVTFYSYRYYYYYYFWA
jgi:hypothetical protein